MLVPLSSLFYLSGHKATDARGSTSNARYVVVPLSFGIILAVAGRVSLKGLPTLTCLSNYGRTQKITPRVGSKSISPF